MCNGAHDMHECCPPFTVSEREREREGGGKDDVAAGAKLKSG